MPHRRRHARITGPIVMIGFGSIGKGTLPLIERHFDYDKRPLRRHRPRRRRTASCSTSAASASSTSAITRDNYREMLGKLLTAGGGQGFCVNLSVDTSSLDIMRSAARSARSTSTPSSSPGPASISTRRAATRRAPTTRCARPCSPSGARNPGGTTAVSCCGANPGMVSWFVKQALVNLAADLGDKARRAEDARGLGPAGAAARRQGRPHRRARHPARQEPEAAQRLRQHLVGRGLRLRGHAAGRTRLGHAREMDARTTPASTRPAAARRSISSSPAPTRACARWTPTARGAIRLPRHPQRVDLDRRLLHACATARARRSTGRPATTPITPATTRCCRCTRCSAAPARCRRMQHILGEHEIVDGIDELGVLLYGHAQQRLLVRLAALGRGDARASRPTRTPPACR